MMEVKTQIQCIWEEITDSLVFPQTLALQWDFARPSQVSLESEGIGGKWDYWPSSSNLQFFFTHSGPSTTGCRLLFLYKTIFSDIRRKCFKIGQYNYVLKLLVAQAIIAIYSTINYHCSMVWLNSHQREPRSFMAPGLTIALSGIFVALRSTLYMSFLDCDHAERIVNIWYTLYMYPR
jgi:hypothetical protein